MVYFGAAPPSWTYPQPVIQQAAPTGKESVGPGKQTGRTPPTTSTVLVRLERGRSHTAINVPADTMIHLTCSACLPLLLHNILTFETDLFYKERSSYLPHPGHIAPPLTRQVHVSDGVQQTHVVVVVVLVEAQVRDHLQRSVVFPQGDV